jgi:hypothetical protein
MHVASKITVISFFMLFMALPALAATTLSSKLEIPKACEQDYKTGNTFLQTELSNGLDLSDRGLFAAKMEEQMATISDDECRFFWSMGVYDAQMAFQQMIAAEYMLELADIEEQDPAYSYASAVKEIYEERFKRAGISTKKFEAIEADLSLRREAVNNLTKSLNKSANTVGKAIPLGRFVFTGLGSGYTLYDYEKQLGQGIIRDDKGQPKLGQGSYQRIAAKNYHMAQNVVREYLDWQPSIFFGEDSFWRGAWNRYFESKPERTLREVKQDGYERRIRSLKEFARAMKLDTSPYTNLQILMNKQERQILARDISIYNSMAKNWYTPLLVPVGMYVGGALLVKSGYFVATTASAGTYAGASLAAGANVSAAISLGVISSYAGIGAYQGYKHASKSPAGFTMAHAFDYIIGASINSFTLAAIAPVAIGATILGGQQIFSGVKTVLSSAVRLGSFVRVAGPGGTARTVGSMLVKLPGQLLRLPKNVFQAWLSAWYKDPKFLLTNYGVDIFLTVAFDCGYRQYSLEGKNRCTWIDEEGRHLNEQFLYSLGGTVVMGAISQPLIFVKTFGARWMGYRGLGLFSSVVTQLLISGHIDQRRLAFDQVYGSTLATGFGEWERTIKLSDFVRTQPVYKQAVLLLALRVLIMNPIKNPVRIFIQDSYVVDKKSVSSMLRVLFEDHIQIDLSGFSDNDIDDAYAELLEDEEVLELLNNVASED